MSVKLLLCVLDAEKKRLIEKKVFKYALLSGGLIN